MKETVIFYRDWHEAIKDFSPDERLKAYDAIMLYAFEDTVPDDKFIKAATALMRSTIDRDNNKYEEKCERNRRNIASRWKRLREAQKLATNGYEPIRPNTTATDNGNDNENDNGNDNGNDNEPTTIVVGDKEKKEKKSTEKKKKVAAAPVRFRKPTVEEVAAYCKERGNYVDAQHFVDFYESKDWKVGSSPMKDWKAAVRTWEQRDGRTRKPAPKGTTLGVGEWIDEQGERRYGSGQHSAPMSAPPRPSEGSYWSAESNQWVSGV